MILSKEKHSPTEIWIINALQQMARLFNEAHDLGPQLLRLGLNGLCLASSSAEEHGFHLEQVLKKEGIHLGDELDE